MIPKVYFETIDNLSYSEAWEYQQQLQKELISAKRDAAQQQLKSFSQDHYLLFCHHQPVYTLGKSGSLDHLLMSEEELSANKIEFFKINRGGDITYHGPGQITGYPIFDLEEFSTDVHLYVRNLEEVVIRTLATYGIFGERIEGFTGVWIKDDVTKIHRKICAIGVHLSRWVTMHGFAFNVNTDLSYFKNIIPCGIADEDKIVTSLANELGVNVEIEEVELRLRNAFKEVFNLQLIAKHERITS